jgi:chorismate synthase
MAIEKDDFEIVAGVRGGFSLGSPLGIVIHNTEKEKWAHVMPVEGAPGGRPLTRPRPGHADLPGMQKYGFTDARNVLERASARETAARVALATPVRSMLRELGIVVVSHVLAIGDAATSSDRIPGPEDLDTVDESSVRCFDDVGTAAMVDAIEKAAAEGDSLGGLVEVIAYGVPTGLGSHVHWDRKIDGRLAGALMAVPAIKGVSIGDGFEIARTLGSSAHDEIETDLRRTTDRAGGTEGGMTIGGTLRVRAAMKPLSTLKKRLRTVDLATGDPADAFQERTDVCAVPAAAVVCESVVALVLGDALLEMFGGDTLADLSERVESFSRRIRGDR